MKLFVILKKELSDQVRDKRTMVAAVFMPAVIVPLLLYVMSQTAMAASKTPIRIVLREAAPGLQEAVREAFPDVLFSFSPAPAEEVKKGAAELGIDAETAGGRYRSLTLHFDPSRRGSAEAYAKIAARLSAAFAAPAAAEGVKIVAAATRGAKESESLLTLSTLLPVFLIIFAASSTMSSAIDLTAGEKERGTIETLISCDVDRRSVILGKALAAATVGLTASVSLLAGLAVGSEIHPGITGGRPLSAFFDPGEACLLAAASMVSAVLFSALGMAIGLYAKSVKEGTILTLPVIVLSSALSSGFVGGDPFSVEPYFYFVPILNLSCVVRSLVFARPDPIGISISAVADIAYAATLLVLCAALLKRETVVCRS